MYQQKGWIIYRHMRDWASLHNIIFPKSNMSHGFNIRIREILGEVRDRSHGNDCLHTAGLIKVFPYIPPCTLVCGPKQ